MNATTPPPGTADARVRRIGLGTAQFGLAYGISNSGGQVPLETVQAILTRATGLGITHLDTAPAYGTAESVVGAVIVDQPQFRVSTKTLA